MSKSREVVSSSILGNNYKCKVAMKSNKEKYLKTKEIESEDQLPYFLLFCEAQVNIVNNLRTKLLKSILKSQEVNFLHKQNKYNELQTSFIIFLIM